MNCIIIQIFFLLWSDVVRELSYTVPNDCIRHKKVEKDVPPTPICNAINEIHEPENGTKSTGETIRISFVF